MSTEEEVTDLRNIKDIVMDSTIQDLIVAKQTPLEKSSTRKIF